MIGEILDGKPWTEMSRAEKLKAHDTILTAFKVCAEAMRQQFDAILAEGGCTMRTTVNILLDIDPNDDPRLPCTHKHWDPEKHGRHCDCGALMYDPGD